MDLHLVYIRNTIQSISYRPEVEIADVCAYLENKWPDSNYSILAYQQILGWLQPVLWWCADKPEGTAKPVCAVFSSFVFKYAKVCVHISKVAPTMSMQTLGHLARILVMTIFRLHSPAALAILLMRLDWMFAALPDHGTVLHLTKILDELQFFNRLLKKMWATPSILGNLVCLECVRMLVETTGSSSKSSRAVIRTIFCLLENTLHTEDCASLLHVLVEVVQTTPNLNIPEVCNTHNLKVLWERYVEVSNDPYILLSYIQLIDILAVHAAKLDESEDFVQTVIAPMVDKAVETTYPCKISMHLCQMLRHMHRLCKPTTLAPVTFKYSRYLLSIPFILRTVLRALLQMLEVVDEIVKCDTVIFRGVLVLLNKCNAEIKFTVYTSVMRWLKEWLVVSLVHNLGYHNIVLDEFFSVLNFEHDDSLDPYLFLTLQDKCSRYVRMRPALMKEWVSDKYNVFPI